MTKPQEFQQQRIIRRDTPYTIQDGFPKGPQAGSGVLTTGRVVWTRSSHDPEGNATAFAEGIGVVSVDPLSL